MLYLHNEQLPFHLLTLLHFSLISLFLNFLHSTNQTIPTLGLLLALFLYSTFHVVRVVPLLAMSLFATIKIPAARAATYVPCHLSITGVFEPVLQCLKPTVDEA